MVKPRAAGWWEGQTDGLTGRACVSGALNMRLLVLYNGLFILNLCLFFERKTQTEASVDRRSQLQLLSRIFKPSKHKVIKFCTTWLNVLKIVCYFCTLTNGEKHQK